LKMAGASLSPCPASTSSSLPPGLGNMCGRPWWWWWCRWDARWRFSDLLLVQPSFSHTQTFRKRFRKCQTS
jgi:hypothetical protein